MGKTAWILIAIILVSLLTSGCSADPVVATDEFVRDEKMFGIFIGFSETFWNNFIRGLLPKILEKLKETIFKSGTLKVDLKDLATIYFTVEGFQILQFTYDLNNTKVDLISSNNTMGLHISNSTVMANLTYDLDLDPAILSDKGEMILGYRNFSLDLVFGIGDPQDPSKVKITVTTNNFNLNPSDIILNLNNTNDFDKMMMFIFNTTKAPFVNIAERAFRDYLEVGLNTAISKIPYPFTIGNMSLDASYVEAPKIFETYTSNKLNGTFYPNNKTLPFSQTKALPGWDDKGRSLQLYISEFSVQSLFYSEFVLGNIRITLDNSTATAVSFTTDSFAFFLPGILKTYGSGKATRISLVAVDSYPIINIKSKEILLNGTFNMEIDVEVEKGVWKNAVIFDLNALFRGNIQLTGKLLLKISISDITLSLNGVKETTIGKIDIFSLSLLTVMIEFLIKNSINLLFIAGIDLNKYIDIPLDLGDVDVILGDGYLTIQSTPHFDSETNTNAFNIFIDKYITKLFSSEDLLTSSDKYSTLAKSVKSAVIEQTNKANFKETLGRHQLGAIKSAYKGYKFFESVLNLPNKNYEQEDLSDL